MPASLLSIFFFFFLISFISVVVLKGFNLSTLLVFRGTPFSYCVLPKAIVNRFLPETIVVTVTGVLKCLYCTDKVHYNEAETKSSVTLINLY